ncbi:predicted protein [Uncinocarpus reesii 1704]|uniref:Uncharacterized protein n=1 Tax=Uncinocarpus reesii (strain UAMH 1704) TaxID=336963 RepID=C4JSQ7_UNCRE|nr:uncharacterized protein UREG_05496 [Uncinocarpus reesii 1704]EEP80654.1 predicted protein [Uncinocarpus reesii 1704]
MEPTILVVLFAGLTIFSNWFSVPLTTLNPQRPVAERLVGSFQLTAAAQGVSALYCRFNQPVNDFSSLLNQTLPSTDPVLGETLVSRVLETATDDSIPSATVTTAIIPTPTVPFGGAEHIVFDNFLVEDSSEYPEWFVARLGLLVGDHMRRHPNIYTVAASLVLVQSMVMMWFARQIQRLTRELHGVSSQPLEGAGFEHVQAQLAAEQSRVNSFIAKFEGFVDNFQSLERRFNDLSATVSAWPQQIPELVGDGLVQIRTQVDQFDARFEQLQRQVTDFATEKATNAKDSGFLQSLQDQVQGLVAQWEAKPWELPQSELAVRLQGFNERLEQLPPSSPSVDSKELTTRITRLQKDLDQWKESVVMNSEVASVEASLRLIQKKVDSQPWTESFTRVEDEIATLSHELSSVKKTSTTLETEQKNLAADVKLVGQFVNQLKAEQPWQRGSSLTDVQLAAVNEIAALKETLATKQETKALSDAIRRTDGSLETWISKTWPADLLKLEKSSKELERSFNGELDSIRSHCATHEDVKYACKQLNTQVSNDLKTRDKSIDSLKSDVNGLSAKVKDLEARPVGGSVQGAVTIEELKKVKDMAREADNSAISSALAVQDLRERALQAGRDITGINSILRIHEFDIASCVTKLGIERKKVTFGAAPSGQAPPSQVPAKNDAKPGKPTTSPPGSKEEKPPVSQSSVTEGADSKSESKSDKKDEPPATGSSEKSAVPQGETESKPKSPETSTSVEPKLPGLEASRWASAGPTEPKPAGLEASRWATATPEPKPPGLESQPLGSSRSSKFRWRRPKERRFKEGQEKISAPE